MEVSVVEIAQALLFVPGDRPDRFAKAVAACPEGVVLDLEDAVPREHKYAARINVQNWLAAGGSGLVRVNGYGTEWYAKDLAALSGAPAAVMLPKVESSREINDILQKLPVGSCVVPILETAVGVLRAPEICSVPGVVRVAFGNGDLAAQLGVDMGDRTAFVHARSALVLASAAGGIARPLDGVTTAINDSATLIADAEHAAALGFGGKLCIHPGQVSVVAKAFAPTDEEVAWAHKIIEADVNGSVRQVDGEMIDKPIVSRAKQLLARVRR